jgi:NADPH-dependent curcumin reductase CurA
LTALPLLNPFARMPVCGVAGWYNRYGLPDGPDMGPVIMGTVLRMKVKMQGSIIFDSFPRSLYAEFTREMTAWLDAGKIHYTEEVIEGLENAPESLYGLLEGRSFGKRVVKL